MYMLPRFSAGTPRHVVVPGRQQAMSPAARRERERRFGAGRFLMPPGTLTPFFFSRSYAAVEPRRRRLLSATRLFYRYIPTLLPLRHRRYATRACV